MKHGGEVKEYYWGLKVQKRSFLGVLKVCKKSFLTVLKVRYEGIRFMMLQSVVVLKL
jgi:hypothetical protein